MQSCSARRLALALCLLIVGRPASAESLVLDQLQTEEIRLLYQDPQQTYLTPYVARCFLNSLEFQKRIFRWTPYEKTTVVLTDLSDYGNGSGAGVAAEHRRHRTLADQPRLRDHAQQRALPFAGQP